MTLHEAVLHFRLSPIHDFQRHDERDGKFVALYALGLWESDLQHLQEMVPDLRVRELRRTKHEDGDWLRVDVMEAA